MPDLTKKITIRNGIMHLVKIVETNMTRRADRSVLRWFYGKNGIGRLDCGTCSLIALLIQRILGLLNCE